MAKNLHVWNLRTKSQEVSLNQRVMTKEQWPAVQFSSDDGYAAHMVSNVVNIYSTQGKDRKSVV